MISENPEKENILKEIFARINNFNANLFNKISIEPSIVIPIGLTKVTLKIKDNKNQKPSDIIASSEIAERYDTTTSVITEFKSLAEKLAKLDIKFLIMFDELDRCSPELIGELLTCIKQTLLREKISNVFYLSAVNREQIDGILSPKESFESYLDKIFEHTFELENDTEL
jgi:hypothetical protein